MKGKTKYEIPKAERKGRWFLVRTESEEKKKSWKGKGKGFQLLNGSRIVECACPVSYLMELVALLFTLV
ncbi:unnamed protein product [Sphenostylis stenocarpa]|uniref:Uncharacterized protein n=1 Tax=Sphenostylis stenocarpa TaxID=92480 RepID=A0AA86SE29_9FABA|nr:unnamed protein product [Sphenostylis stenocarpa]